MDFRIGDRIWGSYRGEWQLGVCTRIDVTLTERHCFVVWEHGPNHALPLIPADCLACEPIWHTPQITRPRPIRGVLPPAKWAGYQPGDHFGSTVSQWVGLVTRFHEHSPLVVEWTHPWGVTPLGSPTICPVLSRGVRGVYLPRRYPVIRLEP